MPATAQMLTPTPEARGVRRGVGNISRDIESADARASIRKHTRGKATWRSFGKNRFERDLTYMSRVLMTVPDFKVRWTGHFSAISSSLDRCSELSGPVNSISRSI
jgi:hypothetical protein